MHDFEVTQGFYEQEMPFGEGGFETQGLFSEQEEMELAAELLSVTNEQELDQFIGSLFKKVKGVVGKIAGPLGGVLKSVAKQALPGLGAALGSFIPIPGVGTAIGGALGTAAGNLFGAELEGLSPEDQEFELAQRFVRFAGSAVRKASDYLASHPDARNAIKQALIEAAQKFAPGLMNQLGGLLGESPSFLPQQPGYQQPGYPGYSPQSAYGLPSTGRWYRRGRTVLVVGV